MVKHPITSIVCSSRRLVLKQMVHSHLLFCWHHVGICPGEYKLHTGELSSSELVTLSTPDFVHLQINIISHTFVVISELKWILKANLIVIIK